MTDIDRLLRRAAYRLFVADSIRLTAITLTVLFALLIVALLGARTLGFALPWKAIIGTGLAVSVLVALLAAVVLRARGVRLARIVDDRAGLRETISTAMCVADRDDAWSATVVETARERARRVVIRDAFPVRAPSLWPVPVASALAFTILIAIPWNLDLMGRLATLREAEREQEELVRVKAEVKATEDRLSESLKRAGVTLEKDNAFELPETENPRELQQNTMRRLTELKDHLTSMRKGEKAEQMKAVQDQMRRVKLPGQGPLDDLGRAMTRGDFSKAMEELQELQRQLASDELADADKAALKEQLEKLSEQMEKLAEDRKDLEQQLQKAGLTPEQARQAARDPEALKRAIEQMQGLTDEQKQQLMKQSQAQCAACESAAQMGMAMAQAAQGMSQQGMSGEGLEGLESLAGQLSQMEMLSMDLANMDAAMGELDQQMQLYGQMLGQCENGKSFGDPNMMARYAGIGQWQPGDRTDPGLGSGGPGRGYGGEGTGGEETDFEAQKQKARSKNTGGPIIGRRYVYGAQIRGESVLEFADAVAAAGDSVTAEINSQRVPTEFKSAVQHYFGELQAQVEATKASAAPAGESGNDE
jgi:hypothetical protein